jgi:hypothetical protein
VGGEWEGRGSSGWGRGGDWIRDDMEGEWSWDLGTYLYVVPEGVIEVVGGAERTDGMFDVDEAEIEGECVRMVAVAAGPRKGVGREAGVGGETGDGSSDPAPVEPESRAERDIFALIFGAPSFALSIGVTLADSTEMLAVRTRTEPDEEPDGTNRGSDGVPGVERSADRETAAVCLMTGDDDEDGDE